MGTTGSLSVPDRLENLSSSASAAPLVKLHEVTTNIGKGRGGGGGGGRVGTPGAPPLDPPPYKLK